MRTLSSQASRRLTLAELYSTIICLPLSVTRSDILSPKLSYFISSPMQLGHGKMGHVWYGWSTVKVRCCERCGPVEGGRLNQDGKDWHNWQVMFSLNKIVSNILISNFGWLQALFVTHSQVTVIAVQYLTEVLLWRVEITTCIQTDNSWGIEYARPGTPRWCDQWSSQYGCCWWPGAYWRQDICNNHEDLRSANLILGRKSAQPLKMHRRPQHSYETASWCHHHRHHLDRLHHLKARNSMAPELSPLTQLYSTLEPALSNDWYRVICVESMYHPVMYSHAWFHCVSGPLINPFTC